MAEYWTDQETIERFLNFEINWSEVGAGPEDDVKWHGECFLTFHHILNALYRMKTEMMSVVMVDSEYIALLMQLADRVHLPEAVGYPGKRFHDLNWNDALDRVPFERESTLFSVIAYLYHEADYLGAGEDRRIEVDEWIEMMENTLDNEYLPVAQWKLSEIQKMHFLMYVHGHDLVDYLDEGKQELFGKCLDEMCEKGVYSALKIQADCCAGGNMLYDCDWEYAKEVYEILYKEQEDTAAAMRLGEIYYKGYTGEAPDYEKAWKYASVAAMAKLHGAMLLCAQMLAEGKGMPANRSVAAGIAREVYSFSKTMFIDGYHNTYFADAALMMGRFYLEGIGCEADPMLAGSYLMDCRNALNCRMHYAMRKEDEQLEKELEGCLDELLRRYGALFTAKEDRRNDPFVLDRLLSGGCDLSAVLVRDSEGDFLKIQREDRGMMILTCEQLLYSRLKKDVVLRLEGLEKTDLSEESGTVFDRIGYDPASGTTNFYQRGKQIAFLTLESYFFEDDRPEGYIKEEKVRFAAVRFGESDEIYDYLCDLEDVGHGDMVMVDSRGLLQEAHVCWVFQAKMSDMPLKPERYKYILHKVAKTILS